MKPYVKTNKNDTIDADAIAEAVTPPTMRVVQIKRTEQVDTQSLHRVRERMVLERTRLICQMRAFCLEYGIPIRQGAGVFKLDLPLVLADETNELTPVMRCLMSIPGIGPLGATATIAAVGDGRQFRKARDFVAWLGIVPKQATTRGRPTLLGISKRGNPYVRKLLIHGARSCVLHLDRTLDRLGQWLDSLEKRMHKNKVAVALANKIARIVWVVLNRPGVSYRREDPAFA